MDNTVDTILGKFRHHVEKVLQALPTRDHLKDYLYVAEEKGLELPMQWESYDIHGLRRLVMFHEEEEFKKQMKLHLNHQNVVQLNNGRNRNPQESGQP